MLYKDSGSHNTAVSRRGPRPNIHKSVSEVGGRRCRRVIDSPLSDVLPKTTLLLLPTTQTTHPLPNGRRLARHRTLQAPSDRVIDCCPSVHLSRWRASSALLGAPPPAWLPRAICARRLHSPDRLTRGPRPCPSTTRRCTACSTRKRSANVPASSSSVGVGVGGSAAARFAGCTREPARAARRMRAPAYRRAFTALYPYLSEPGYEYTFADCPHLQSTETILEFKKSATTKNNNSGSVT